MNSVVARPSSFPATPSNLDAALDRLRTVSQGGEREAFVSRTLQALAHLVASADERDLLAAVGAPSDYDVLLQVLEGSLGLELLADPLAAAKVRGLQTRERLLTAEGGTLTVGAVARHLGISRQAVDKRRRAGKLIGLGTGRRGYVYPTWQLDERAGLLPGLVSVLSELAEHDPWMRLSFFLTPNVRLLDQRPLDLLRQGDEAAVRSAARAFGVHGAP
jgi:hypothetical protein